MIKSFFTKPLEIRALVKKFGMTSFVICGDRIIIQLTYQKNVNVNNIVHNDEVSNEYDIRL